MTYNLKIRFYLNASGRSPVEEFLQECSDGLRQDFFDAVALLAEGEKLSMPVSRNLSNITPGLHELRLKDRSGQVRIFYFIKKHEAIYLIHALIKKLRNFLSMK